MLSIHSTDSVVLKRHSTRSTTADRAVVFEDSAIDLSRPIRTASKNRRATLIGIPPTLINTSSEDLQHNQHVQPTVFFYDESRFQEACYRSIEDIPDVEENQCLWIDVTGVSFDESMENIHSSFRFMITIFSLDLVVDSIFILSLLLISKSLNNERN